MLQAAIKIILLSLLLIHTAAAGGSEIRISNLGLIFVPQGAQLCADTIFVEEGGTYITEIREGTCPTAHITGGGTIVLPVELSSFTASIKDGYVFLNWITQTEVDNYGFEIQRSNDSTSNNWQKIAFVPGSGNSNSHKEYHYTDKSLIGGSEFFYRLKQIDTDGQFTFSEIISIVNLPLRFELHQNYPNPFNAGTVITFAIPEKTKVVLNIYNILGEKISEELNKELDPGFYDVNLTFNNLSSGVYIYSIETKDNIAAKKMILLR